MKGIIWYIDKLAGQAECEKIIHNYQRKEIEIVKKITSGGNQQILFSNGDIWNVCYASDSARGSCCNISLIEKNIPKQIIETIIIPCTKALPYTAFKYYSFDEYIYDSYI